jgi:hypothetical protein
LAARKCETWGEFEREREKLELRIPIKKGESRGDAFFEKRRKRR